MVRPSVLIMGATVSAKYTSGRVVSGDRCDKEGLYQMEAGCHLQAERNGRQEQQNGHDPGVVGGGDGGQASLPQAGRNLPAGFPDGRSSQAPNRPLVRGGLRQPTTRRKQSHLASLPP